MSRACPGPDPRALMTPRPRAAPEPRAASGPRSSTWHQGPSRAGSRAATPRECMRRDLCRQWRVQHVARRLCIRDACGEAGRHGARRSASIHRSGRRRPASLAPTAALLSLGRRTAAAAATRRRCICRSETRRPCARRRRAAAAP
eukprot:scaffold115728_cov67-Phaeocystis_antarctica.AAC.8